LPTPDVTQRRRGSLSGPPRAPAVAPNPAIRVMLRGLPCRVAMDNEGAELSTLRFARFDDVLLLVCGSQTLSRSDWSVWSLAYARAAAEHGVRRLLVLTTGRGPDARQRSEVITAVMSRIGRDIGQMRTAVCGDTRFWRAVNMALAWMAGVTLRGFGYEERRAALQYLAVPEIQRAQILLAAERFATALERRTVHAS
jgi:hypothetical protein